MCSPPDCGSCASSGDGKDKGAALAVIAAAVIAASAIVFSAFAVSAFGEASEYNRGNQEVRLTDPQAADVRKVFKGLRNERVLRGFSWTSLAAGSACLVTLCALVAMGRASQAQMVNYSAGGVGGFIGAGIFYVASKSCDPSEAYDSLKRAPQPRGYTPYQQPGQPYGQPAAAYPAPAAVPFVRPPATAPRVDEPPAYSAAVPRGHAGAPVVPSAPPK